MGRPRVALQEWQLAIAVCTLPLACGGSQATGWLLESAGPPMPGAACSRPIHARAACASPPQFLTNVFLPVYLAQRLRPDPLPEGPAPGASAASATAATAAGGTGELPAALPDYAPIFGGVAMAVGAISVGWALGARPEAGDLAARWDYFSSLLATSRVDWAFVVDAGLYAVWQAWLLGAAGAAPAYRFVPFWGMAAWLLTGPRGGDATEKSRAAQ